MGRRLVVAFRGTEQTKLKDLLTDIALAPAGFNPERAGGGDFDKEAMVHSGFLQAYDSVRPRILLLLKTLTGPSRTQRGAGGKESDKGSGGESDKGGGGWSEGLRWGWGGGTAERKDGDETSKQESGEGEGIEGGGGPEKPWHLYITGHSLGGALATLLTKDLSVAKFIKERGVSLTMYNYGSPRVGNGVFAEEYNRNVHDSWRVVNHRDIIPTVPRLMGYRHVCCPVYLNPLPPLASATSGEEQSQSQSQEEDGYLGDLIGEKTTTDLVSKVLEGEAMLFDRLLQTEISMLNALRDGSAISMHMEDFYYVALLKKVQGGYGSQG